MVPSGLLATAVAAAAGGPLDVARPPDVGRGPANRGAGLLPGGLPVPRRGRGGHLGAARRHGLVGRDGAALERDIDVQLPLRAGEVIRRMRRLSGENRRLACDPRRLGALADDLGRDDNDAHGVLRGASSPDSRSIRNRESDVFVLPRLSGSG